MFPYHLCSTPLAPASPPPYLPTTLLSAHPQVLTKAAARSKVRMAEGHEPACLLDFWTKQVGRGAGGGQGGLHRDGQAGRAV